MDWITNNGDVLASGFVGAALGSIVSAVTAWTVSGRQIKASEKTRHRNDLVSLIGEAWGAADQLWRARQGLAFAVFEIVIDRRSSDLSGEARAERRAQLESNRQEAFSQIREAETVLARCTGMLRITEPDLATAAKELRDASWAYDHKAAEDPDRAKELTAARDAALADFEATAARALRE